MKIYAALICFLLAACGQRQRSMEESTWADDSGSVNSEEIDLSEIQSNGEMIMVTLSGPQTIYDYHGKQLGAMYMLCQKFADELGVTLRVDICRDTTEIIRKLTNGDADIAAFYLPKSLSNDSLIYCGPKLDSLNVQWAVGYGKDELADKLKKWYRPAFLADVNKEETFLLSHRSIKRRVFSPMLNAKGGIISHYDQLFINYSRIIRWDWRLMAAQCYQESTFDPQARSWAGACGLMQIMPGTAEQLGLPAASIFEPESNIAAAAKYIGQLTEKFSDVSNSSERTKFVLASYNGGFFHIRDAMALAQKHGRNPHRWDDVAPYVLQLSNPTYYNDPIVEHGYMRGSETVDYVAKILQRWASYRGVKSVSRIGITTLGTPRRATHERKKKYQ